MTRSKTVGISVALVALALAVAQGMELARRDVRAGFQRPPLHLPSAAQARLLSLGFRTLLADYYWVESLQYFMDPEWRHENYSHLADYVNLVVDVDPDFHYAYKFGGLTIPYDTGRYHFKNTEQSTALLRKGVQRFPEDWYLHFLLGYNLLFFEHQPAEAAQYFAKAAELPGSPKYLKAFAARVWAVGGEIDRAILFTEETLKRTEDPETRHMLEQRIVDLNVEKQLRRIEDAAHQFKDKNGRFPRNLDELKANGFGDAPEGYSLGADGVAHSSIKADRMIIHSEPAIDFPE